MERDLNLVSVIIPCYNHGRFICEAIESIRAQTWRDFEIIVVDDGSDDPETIDVLGNLDVPRVRVFRTENAHLSAARNFGIRQSAGAFILTLDADDRFEPTFIEKGMKVLNQEPGIGVVTCFVKPFGSSQAEAFLPEGGGVENFLLKNNCCGNALFRYQCWVDAGGYNEAMRGFEDWDFWIGVTKHGWRVKTIPEFLFFYRDTEGSMYKSVNSRRPELFRAIVENHVELFREHIVDVLYRKERRIKYLKDHLRRLKASRSGWSRLRKLTRFSRVWKKLK